MVSRAGGQAKIAGRATCPSHRQHVYPSLTLAAWVRVGAGHYRTPSEGEIAEMGAQDSLRKGRNSTGEPMQTRVAAGHTEKSLTAAAVRPSYPLGHLGSLPPGEAEKISSNVRSCGG